jgi:two-component system, LytTR family, sensor kinase
MTPGEREAVQRELVRAARADREAHHAAAALSAATVVPRLDDPPDLAALLADLHRADAGAARALRRLLIALADYGALDAAGVEPTDEWEQIELLCGWPEQREYEIVRPLVLFANLFTSFLYYSLWSLLYFLFYFLDNYNSTLKYQARINEIKLIHLRNQLNPHFIFNALNSVRALVDEDPLKAKSAITQLSSILRYSLIMDKYKTIPFGEELDTVKDYLNLESIRFEERLKVLYDIEEQAYQYKIPPMMLQTIVENAIKHGISNLMKGGIIEIKCTIGLLDDLYIWVKNSAQLKQHGNAKRRGEGHGISNTIQRLKLIYGSRASFKIFNYGQDFVVTEIKIPKQNINLD